MARFENIDVKYSVSFHIPHNVHTQYVSSRLARLNLLDVMRTAGDESMELFCPTRI